jgi:hypothetical protein
MQLPDFRAQGDRARSAGHTKLDTPMPMQLEAIHRRIARVAAQMGYVDWENVTRTRRTADTEWIIGQITVSLASKQKSQKTVAIPLSFRDFLREAAGMPVSPYGIQPSLRFASGSHRFCSPFQRAVFT